MVTVDVNCIHKTVSTEKIELARRAEKVILAAKEQHQENVQKIETKTSDDEYVVECMVYHKNKDEKTNRQVLWHSYRPTGARRKPSHHNNQHPIERC